MSAPPTPKNHPERKERKRITPLYTPAILYECQNKRLTKFAFRKWLILKGASSIDYSTGKETGEKKSDSRAAAFQTQDYPFITITEKVERVKEKLESMAENVGLKENFKDSAGEAPALVVALLRDLRLAQVALALEALIQAFLRRNPGLRVPDILRSMRRKIR